MAETVASMIAELVRRTHAESGWAGDPVARNVIKLGEEYGEANGAYLRWTGQTRRSGTREEFEAELADVGITLRVLAEELGIDLDALMARKIERIYARGWRAPEELGRNG